MSDPVAVANIPITDDPDTFGTQVYSLAVAGGTLYFSYTRQPNGQNPTTAVAFVADGASADAAPQVVNSTAAVTLTAAELLGGPILRTGMTAARSDTLDTAALIQAAWAGNTGSSRVIEINNQSAFPETLLTAAGLTLTGSTVIQANSAASFLMQWTGAGTITITRISSATQNIPNAQYSTPLNATTGSLPAGAITGAKSVVLLSSNAVPGAQLVRTAAQMLTDIPGAAAGLTWMLRIINTGAGVFTLTADGGATVTLAGTMTVAQNTFRDFVCVLNTATTATITDAGKGTYD